MCTETNIQRKVTIRVTNLQLLKLSIHCIQEAIAVVKSKHTAIVVKIYEGREKGVYEWLHT